MEKDYLKDISEIRNMMERSSKFFSISGWSGVLAGLYSIIGAWLIYTYYQFNPSQVQGLHPDSMWNMDILYIAIGVLVLAMFTALVLSLKKAHKQGQSIWNGTSKRMLRQMLVPLVAGGCFALLSLHYQLFGLMAPITLIFYGIALVNASLFTYPAIRFLGYVQIILGLVATWQIQLGILCWVIGFGLFHIIIGIYLQLRQKA
ncbi:MAG: hypothetical protein EOO99_05125 [Pedobacter sp.]|nr:MAG: hypothetical protein EOO99_05125 [Pedobacter sp.]